MRRFNDRFTDLHDSLIFARVLTTGTYTLALKANGLKLRPLQREHNVPETHARYSNHPLAITCAAYTLA